MGKVSFVMTISSIEYRSLTNALLRQEEIIFQEGIAGSENNKNLLEFLKGHISVLSDYDAVVIDLNALCNTAEEVMKAIESIRFFNDGIRIILIGNRPDGLEILHQCFLNGIYDLIRTTDMNQLRDELRHCLCQGMTYKDALPFRNPNSFSQPASGEPEKHNIHKSVCFLGSENRIGTTHSMIAAAYTLQKAGYLVAVVDGTGKADFDSLLYSYGLTQEENGEVRYFKTENIDFYVPPAGDAPFHPGAEYNFVLYDGGVCNGSVLETEMVKAVDERVLLTGSKPWELPFLSQAISLLNSFDDSYQCLFNFTAEELQPDLIKMMNNGGISEERIYFLPGMPDFFSENAVFLGMFGILQNVKKKRKWFQKR